MQPNSVLDGIIENAREGIAVGIPCKDRALGPPMGGFSQMMDEGEMKRKITEVIRRKHLPGVSISVEKPEK
jgi:hypothetical protein